MSENELNLAELHGTTSEELYTEAMNTERIPTGEYVGIVVKAFGRTVPVDNDFNPGREYASLLVEVYDPEDVSRKVGSFYPKVSWEKRLTKSGKLDNQSKHWVELMRAVGAAPTDSVPAVIEKAQQSMFRLSVEETFRVMPEDVHPAHMDQVRNPDQETWIRLSATDDTWMHYVDLGLEPMTVVRRYRKY